MRFTLIHVIAKCRDLKDDYDENEKNGIIELVSRSNNINITNQFGSTVEQSARICSNNENNLNFLLKTLKIVIAKKKCRLYFTLGKFMKDKSNLNKYATREIMKYIDGEDL